MRHPSSVAATAALSLLLACGGDTTGPANPSPPNGPTMSARIDGADWSATEIVTDSMAPSLLVLRGHNATATLALGIPVNYGPGTQAVGSPTPVFAMLIAGDQWWAASRTQGGNGSVTLTTVSPGHVAGTFSFTMGTREDESPSAPRVTSGKFDVTY